MIGGIVSGVTSLIKTWLSGRNEKSKAKSAMELAELTNKARLLADTQSNNHSWEMANLTDRDKWLRRISFLMFASPFLVAIFAPHHVATYFQTAIAAVPLWWQQTFMAITGGIWGLASLKNTVLGVVGELKKRGQ